MTAQNHGDGTDCNWAALPRGGKGGYFLVCFFFVGFFSLSFWQTYLICGTKPKFANGSFQLHAGADKQLAGFK